MHEAVCVFGFLGQTELTESRKLAAILAADVVGYSRLASVDEDRILARLRAIRSDLLDPAVSIHRGRTVKKTGDGILAEFRSVVDAVRCAIEIQTSMLDRNAGLDADHRIEFRIGVHLGDVVEENDGDIMGDGVNISARLEGIAKPGAINLSDDAYRQVKSKLDIAVIDLGEFVLKNIAEPIRVYSLNVGQGVLGVTTKNTPLLAPSIPRLSIAVMSFANLPDDKSHGYFADGLIDSLTTDLSLHVPNLFVVGRGSAFSYKGKMIEPRQLGRELGVRYILQGSVQRAGNVVRVNAHLTDTETAMQLWTERFDGDNSDLLALQDQISARIANSLGVAIYVDSTRDPKAMLGNTEAADLALRGWAIFFLGDRTLANFDAAEPLYQKALELEPDNADALIGLGAVMAGRLFNFGVYSLGPEDLIEDVAVARRLLTKGLALRPNSAAGHAAKGITFGVQKRWREALSEISVAHSLDPSSALFSLNLGNVLSSLGEPENALSYFFEGIRRSPRDPSMGFLQLSLGRAQLLLARWDEALEACLKARTQIPSILLVHTALAAAFAQKGEISEARASLMDALLLQPNLSFDWLKDNHYSNEPKYLALAESTLYQGLRKAGLK